MYSDSDDDQDEDRKFFDLTDLVDVEKNFLESALERIEETNFDAFGFSQLLPGYAIQYLMFKICHMYNFYNHFHFSIDRLVNFTSEIANGYFQDNPYHNQFHIVDSLQAMHFLMNSANLKSNFKLNDVFACFIADLIHDYEHPGYTNQFVIRTKHPLAIRYSDSLVLEQHHLAAAF